MSSYSVSLTYCPKFLVCMFYILLVLYSNISRIICLHPSSIIFATFILILVAVFNGFSSFLCSSLCATFIYHFLWPLIIIVFNNPHYNYIFNNLYFLYLQPSFQRSHSDTNSCYKYHLQQRLKASV